jgi:CO dehydrogenase nickel-insertion accessory protein CooC1
MSHERPLAGLRVGVFGKGGAGKSTVTIFLAAALRRQGYSVLVVDADSTNVGLASALGIAREPAPLLEFFGGAVFSGGLVTCPVDDPVRLAGASVSLDALPPDYVGRNADGVWLLVAGKLGGLGPGAGCDGPIAKVARDLRVTGVGPDDVVLVDYKAGFEDSARGAMTSLDWALVVVDPTTAAIQMAIDLSQMAAQIRAGVPPATRHLQDTRLVELAVRVYRESRVQGTVCVLNRVRDTATEQRLRRVLKEHDLPVLGVLPETAAIQDQWLTGGRLRSDRLLAGAADVARRLEAQREGALHEGRAASSTGAATTSRHTARQIGAR